MTDAVKVLVQHRRRLTVAFYRKAPKSEVDAWDFTDLQASPSAPHISLSASAPAAQRALHLSKELR
jgi:hypothetical protein